MSIELVIASKNPEKQLRIQQIAEKLGILTSLFSDVSENQFEIIESGKSYLENALLKARYAYHSTHIPSIADDYGMEIDGLDGNPGIYTRRSENKYLNDMDLLAQTMALIRDLPPDRRKCDFVGCGVLVYSLQKYISVSQKDSGYLIPEPRGPLIPGHPLSSLLLIPKYNKTLSELKRDGYLSKDARIYTFLLSEYSTMVSEL